MKARGSGLRHALVYLFIFAAILFSSSFFLYKGLKTLKTEQAKDGLLFEASLISRLITNQGAGLTNPVNKIHLRKTLGSLGSKRWIMVFDPKGELLWSSFKDRAVPYKGFRQLLEKAMTSGPQFIHLIHVPDGIRFFTVLVPLKSGNGAIGGVLGVAINEMRLDPLKGEFQLAVSWLFLLVFVVFILITRFVHLRFRGEVEKMTLPLERFGHQDPRIAAEDVRNGLKRVSPKISSLEGLKGQILTIIDSFSERLSKCDNRLQRLSLLFENMKEPVFLLDGQKRVLTMNRAAEDLAHIPCKKALGRGFSTLFRELDLKYFIDDVYKAKKDSEIELPLFTGKDGLEKRFFLIKAVTIFDHANDRRRLSGVLLVMDDITRLKRLENTRREFVANVSHELKTPITAIKGYAETLLDGVGEQDIEERFLGIIWRQAKRLENLVEDILSLSHMEAQEGKTSLSLKKVKIGDLLGGAVETCRVLAGEKDIEIKISSKQHDLVVEVDQTLMEQAITNLLTNAINYSPRGSSVTVGVEVKGTHLNIRVEDHGKGIAPKDQERIFERFYRVDKARSRQLGGTGLGLAIVKHIVQIHGGRISVKSELGKGSTFTISLPLKK